MSAIMVCSSVIALSVLLVGRRNIADEVEPDKAGVVVGH